MTKVFRSNKSQIFKIVFLCEVALFVRLAAIVGYFQYNLCMLLYDAKHYHKFAVRLTQGLGYVAADGASYFYRLQDILFFW